MARGSRGLEELARDLRGAAAIEQKRVHDIVKRGAQNIKVDWQDALRRRQDLGHIPHLIRAVGYDVRQTKYGATADIGINYTTPQGPLGHFLEFGSVNNPPGHEGARALEREAPRFFGALSRAEGGFL